ncbi:hypothetical protein M885DRAFT_612604 [Pelagophyceae sp. CCMP2097]|nr:hypothetical protein M885DRAFT_612604 [Pelagophyceae sp. CCMP2097]
MVRALGFRLQFAFFLGAQAIGTGCGAGEDAEHVDVVILGAGISGLSAAARLRELKPDWRIAVLEQADRIGGRLWDADFGEGWHIELGANWVEGAALSENPIWAIAQEIGLEGRFTEQEGDAVEPTLYDGSRKVGSAEASALHLRLETALACARRSALNGGLFKGDASLRSYLTAAGWPKPEDQTPLERTLEYFVVDWDFEFGPEDVSAQNYFGGAMRRAASARRLGVTAVANKDDKRFFVTDKRGYAAVARHVASNFTLTNDTAARRTDSNGESRGTVPNDPVVYLSHAALSASWGGEGVCVETCRGAFSAAKGGIVTFSAGVLQDQLSSDFYRPPLPEWKRRALSQAGMGTYTKIFLKYGTKFWTDADYVLYADPAKRGFYAVWQDLSRGEVGADSNVLMVTVVNKLSQVAEQRPVNDTVADVTAALESMYGAVPLPIDVLVPKWHSDAAFRGSFSNIKIGTTIDDFKQMQAPLAGGLYFAGEATDYESNGFVEGGYNSGRDVAEALAKAADHAVRRTPAGL